MPFVTEKEKGGLKEIASEAGSLLLNLYNQELEMIGKGEHDYATGADIESEKLIIERLKQYRLPYTVMAEEKLEGVEFPLTGTPYNMTRFRNPIYHLPIYHLGGEIASHLGNFDIFCAWLGRQDDFRHSSINSPQFLLLCTGELIN